MSSDEPTGCRPPQDRTRFDINQDRFEIQVYGFQDSETVLALQWEFID